MIDQSRQWEPALVAVTGHHLKRYMFAANRVRRGSRVLDAACGCGYGAWLLFVVKGYVDALDISADAIRFANSHYPGPRYAVADITKLKEKTVNHDLVVSFETIEHLLEPQKFLRSLAPQTLIASVPNEELYPFNATTFKDDEYPHHRHYKPQEFDALLAECGFATVERWCQSDKDNCAVRPGTDGKFLIYVAQPIR